MREKGGPSHLGQLQPAGGCGLDHQGNHGQVGVGGFVMPQVSLLPSPGGLGGRLRPRKPQAWVAAGSHAGGDTHRGQGPGPVEARQWGSVERQGWGPEAGGPGGPDPLSFGWKGEGRGGRGREKSAVGEGSVQRTATISRFQLIWKGGAGRIPVGAAGGHPGLIPHPRAAFSTPTSWRGEPLEGACDLRLLYPVWAGLQARI